MSAVLADLPADLLARASAWSAADPDPETRAEVAALMAAKDAAGLADRFGPRLAFGTAGMRGELLPEPSMNRPLSHDKKLCGLFGPDAVVALLAERMAAMDLPVAGLPRAERAKALEALEAKLAKLKATEANLLATAEKAGLAVS